MPAHRLDFPGYVTKEGKLKLYAKRDAMLGEIGEVFRGRQIMLSVKREGKRRSSPQNRYWWKCIVVRVLLAMAEQWGAPLSENVAEHREEVHRFLMRELWADDLKVVDPETGAVLFTKPCSIADLATWEQEELSERARNWAKEHLGITILKPNEQAEIGFDE